MTVILSAERDCAFGRLSESNTLPGTGSAVDPSIGYLVGFRGPAKLHRGNFLQLLFCVQPGRKIRSSVRVRRLAAILLRAPGNEIGGVAPHDLALVPWHPEHFSRNARSIHHGVRPEVSDPLMDVQLTVWFDDEQTVKPGETSRIGTNHRRPTSHFSPAALPVSLFPLLPLEKFDTSVTGFPHPRAFHWLTC